MNVVARIRKVFLLAPVAWLAYAAPAAAACDCGQDVCQGTSVRYPAPAWSDEPYDVVYQFACNGGECACGQYINGDYWVVDDGLTITSMTPQASSGCGGSGTCRNGYMIDPSHSTSVAFDDRILGYAASLHGPDTPFSASPGQIIVKSASRGSLRYNSYVQRQVVLSVVGSAPQNPGDLFRPPYFHSNKPAREYRWSQLSFSALPRVNGACCTAGRPNYQQIRDRFRWPQIDHIRNYYQRSSFAVDNAIWQPGNNYFSNYDMERERDLSASILRLMLDDFAPSTDASHKAALVALLQFGLDMSWAVKNGAYWNEHGRGRISVVLLAAALWGDPELRAAAVDDGFQWMQGGPAKPRGIVIANSNSKCTEAQYWQRMRTGSGNASCSDPYGRIDYGYDLNRGGPYLSCCNVKQMQYTVLISRLLNLDWVLTDAKPHLGAFVDRWKTDGLHASPDTCAPYDGVPGNYGITYGPAPGNSSSCHLTQSCSCIQGGGRFPGAHRTSVNGGGYSSSFAEAMWNRYWQEAGGVPAAPAPPVLIEP